MIIKPKHPVFRRNKILKKLNKNSSKTVKQFIVMIAAVRFLGNVHEDRDKLMNVNLLHSFIHNTLLIQSQKHKLEMAESDGMEQLLMRASGNKAQYSKGAVYEVDSATVACYLLGEIDYMLGDSNNAIIAGILEDSLHYDYITKKALRESSDLAIEFIQDLDKYLYHRRLDGSLNVVGSISIDHNYIMAIGESEKCSA